MRNLSSSQRVAILRAAADAKALSLVDPTKYDAVDLACATDNFWWQGIGDHNARVGLRLISMHLKGVRLG
jgi:hypothetical protein